MRFTAACAVSAFALLLGGAPALAADTAASANEAKLVGAWSENFPAQATNWNADQRAKAAKTGLIGDILQFKADHTFVMYMRCPVAARDGVPQLAGTWELRNGNQLAITMSVKGKTAKLETDVSWESDQFVMRQGGKTSKFRKYPWPLPPAC